MSGSADDLPAAPPPEVLAAVAAAWRRMEELAADGQEVVFSKDPLTGDLQIELRGPRGARRLRPSEVFDVLE